MGLWRSQVAHRTLNPAVEGPNPSRPAFSSLRIHALNQKERHTFKLQRARHNLLKENQDVKRWYDNLARGSRNTAKVRLRRLGLFCEQNHTTPQDLAKIGEKDSRKVEDILFDHISYMESSGKIEYGINQVWRYGVELLRSNLMQCNLGFSAPHVNSNNFKLCQLLVLWN